MCERSVSCLYERFNFGRQVVTLLIRNRERHHFSRHRLHSVDDLLEEVYAFWRQWGLKVHDGADDLRDVLAVLHESLLAHHDLLRVVLFSHRVVGGGKGDAEVIEDVSHWECERNLNRLFGLLVPYGKDFAERLVLAARLHIET